MSCTDHQEVERQKQLLRESQPMRKSSKWRSKHVYWQEKLKNALSKSSHGSDGRRASYSTSGLKSYDAELKKDANRRLSYSDPVTMSSRQAPHIQSPKGVLRRVESTKHFVGSALDNDSASLQQEVLRYQAMHRRLLVETNELIGENEYLQKELETISMKMQSSMLEADDLALKLQESTKQNERGDSEKLQVREILQNCLVSLNVEKTSIDDDLIGLAQKVLYSVAKVINHIEENEEIQPKDIEAGIQRTRYVIWAGAFFLCSIFYFISF